jgi:hypothetical protein
MPCNSCSSDGRVTIWGRLWSGGIADADSCRILVPLWERGELPDREGWRCFCNFLGEWYTDPMTSTLMRRLEVEVFFLWFGAGEARLDAVEADQRFRLRKLSLKPPALLDREGRRCGGRSTSFSESIGRALNGSWKIGGVCPKPESDVIFGGGRREEVRGRKAVADRDGGASAAADVICCTLL